MDELALLRELADAVRDERQAASVYESAMYLATHDKDFDRHVAAARAAMARRCHAWARQERILVELGNGSPA